MLQTLQTLQMLQTLQVLQTLQMLQTLQVLQTSEQCDLFLGRKRVAASLIECKSVVHTDDDTSTEKTLSQHILKDDRHHLKGLGSDTISKSKKTVKSPSRERTLDALKRKQKV